MLKDEIFDYCRNEYPKSKYGDFDFYETFLYLMPSLISTEEQENHFLQMLDSKISKLGDDYSGRYERELLISTKIEYFLVQGKKQPLKLLSKKM